MPRGYPNYHNFLLIFLWLAGVQTLLTKCNVAELGIRSFQKNVPFFSFFSERKQKRTEHSLFFKWKRTERTDRSFIKNGKEEKERNVLLKRMECPTLQVGNNTNMIFYLAR